MTRSAPPDLPDTLARDPAQLSLLGHDLRAAVSDVLGGLRLIELETLDDAARLQLERVRAAGEGLARLLEESLGVLQDGPAAAGPAPDTPAPPLQTARMLYDLEMRWSGRAREKGLGFRMEVAPGVPPLLAVERTALDRVLANLLSNAIKFTDSGEVTMQVHLLPGPVLRLAVRDEGPGFSEAALARLFQYAGRPEDTAKPGHGLGLHISHDLATRMQGRITVENLAPRGAEVGLELPRGSWPLDPDEAPGGGGALPDLSRIRVLVAEDNPTNQTLITQMLHRLGAECELAQDGLEAIGWFEREDFDLALIDVEMPRLSGIEVIRYLRAAPGWRARMPVMAATAYVLRANRDAIYAAGADGILAKPLPRLEQFAHALGALLERSRSQPEAPPAAPAPDDTDFDRARFEQLLDVAGAEVRDELLDRIEADLRRAERALVLALAEGDRSGIRAESHVLVSLAGAVGADRLQHLSEALNRAAHRRDDAALRALGAETLALLDRLIHLIAEEARKRRGGPR